MKILTTFTVICLLFASCNSSTKQQFEYSENPNFNISVSFSETIGATPKDGRLLLMLANNNESEPRFQVGEGLNAQLIYGMNVSEWYPNESKTFTSSDFGFPI